VILRSDAVSLSIEASALDDRTYVVALNGEVDYATAKAFREAVSAALHAGNVHAIVVDLGGVTFLDSTGVGTLVVASRICAELGVRLQVCNVHPFIARLFSVLGVSDALGVGAPAGIVTPRRVPRVRTENTLAQPA
jgi:anti-sigma B factor antagonist